MHDQSMGHSTNGLGTTGVTDRNTSWRHRILKLGTQRSARQTVGAWQAGQIAQRRKQVERLHQGFARRTWLGNPAVANDQWGTYGLVKQSVLTPNGMLAEVPAMITPQNDNRVLHLASRCQRRHHAPHLGIRIAHTSRVSAPYFQGKRGIFVGIAFPTVVLHEFSRPMPGRLARGLVRMGSRRQWHAGIQIVVLLRSAERKVRTQDAHRQEKRLSAVSGQLLQLSERYWNRLSIRVNRIGTRRRLPNIHAASTYANLAVGQPMHPTARVLPGSCWQQVAIPRVGHLKLLPITPVRPTAPPWMV